MIRNIPNRVKTKDLLEQIQSLGFGESFDYYYMPLDLRAQQNKGYAFINSVDGKTAKEFRERVSGATFEGRHSDKLIDVCSADKQGLHSCTQRGGGG